MRKKPILLSTEGVPGDFFCLYRVYSKKSYETTNVTSLDVKHLKNNILIRIIR